MQQQVQALHANITQPPADFKPTTAPVLLSAHRMNTTLHLILQTGGHRETLLHLIDTPAEATSYEGQIRAALKVLMERNPSRPKAGGRGKTVLITAIDDETHNKWVTQRGACHVRDLDNRKFHSARQASLYLGCTSNEVGNGLAAARRQGRTEAKIRGVTFRYADDFGGE